MISIVPPVREERTEDLQDYGNRLVTQARVQAIEAMRLSSVSEFLARGQTVKVADLKRWRRLSREAAKAWAAVDATVSELLSELNRSAPEGTPHE